MLQNEIPMLYYIMPYFSALGCKRKSPFSERGGGEADGVCDERTNPAKIPLLHGGVDARSADGVVKKERVGRFP